MMSLSVRYTINGDPLENAGTYHRLIIRPRELDRDTYLSLKFAIGGGKPWIKLRIVEHGQNSLRNLASNAAQLSKFADLKKTARGEPMTASWDWPACTLTKRVPAGADLTLPSSWRELNQIVV